MRKMHTNKALIIPKSVGLSNHPSAVQYCDHTASTTKKKFLVKMHTVLLFFLH